MKKAFICMTGFRDDCEFPDGIYKRKKDAIDYMRSLNFKYCKKDDQWYLPDIEYNKNTIVGLLGGRIIECELYDE